METVETLNEGLKRAYAVTIPGADIDRRVDAEVKLAAPQVRMPGFRPGKVPANLVRKMHGPALRQDALNKAVQEGVQQLLADQKLRPAMQPAVEIDGDPAAGDVKLNVSLEVLPDVPTPSIEGLKLERLTVPVDENAVDERVEQLVGQNKSFGDGDADRAAETGDLVVMDFLGKVDGVAFEGGTGEDMSVEIGSGRLIPGFEDQLVGVKQGDEKQIAVTFPDDYQAETLKGKAATFDLVIKQVKAPKEAVADDDFAKSLGLESLDQLKGLLRGQAEQELNGLTRTHMKRKLLDQLAEAHDFPVPPSMVEAEFEQIWRQLDHEASHEADPAAARAELENDRDDYRKIAERRVRLGLLLSEIGQQNGVEVSAQEMQRLIAQAAQQYDPKDRERFVQYLQNEPMAAAQLRAPLYEDKVVDFLFAKAEISDRETTREALEAEIEQDAEDFGDHDHDHHHDHDHQHHGHDHDHDHDDGHDHAPAKPKRTAKAKAVSDETEAPAAAKPAGSRAKAAKAKAPADEPAAADKETAKAETKAAKPKKAAAAEAAEPAVADKPAAKTTRKKAGA